MKNFSKRFGIIALTAVIGLLTIACDDATKGGGEGGGTTYVSGDGEKVVLTDSGFTLSQGNDEKIKGTYTTNGSNLTLTITQVYGAVLRDIANGASGSSAISSTKWYTEDQVRTAITNNSGLLTTLLSVYDAEITGTRNGDTLTLTYNGDTTTYDKTGGGSTGGGGGSGSGGTITITDIPSKYNEKYFCCWSDGSPVVFGYQDYDKRTAAKISNGRVTIPAWDFNTKKRYTGTSTGRGMGFSILPSQNVSGSTAIGSGTFAYGITFTNGSVTLSWNNKEAWIDLSELPEF